MSRQRPGLPRQLQRSVPEGEKVARQLAMSSDGDQDALMEALLGEGSDD